MAKVHEIIATVFGLGHLPAAPGTWGSAAGLVLCLLLYDVPVLYFMVFVVIFVVGGIAAGALEKKDGVKDPSYVVIDEFACVFIVFVFIPVTILHVVLGFVLFRFFDVIKPPPIRAIERIGGGWGIMLDDAAAAIYANLILQILLLLGI
jgi:phosphatidylglycerophosphatase A